MTETHRLIETATEPLAGNEEQRTAAISILEDAFVADHPAAAETMARLEKAARRKHPALWQVLLWTLAIATLAGALAQFRPAIQFARYWSSISWFAWQRPPSPEGLSERERLLLGDPSLNNLEQKRRLHLSDPDNPAYFAEYARAWSSVNGGLPPDYLETVERIAPGNAYFHYFAAAQIGWESIERKRSTGVPQKPRMADGVRLSPLPRESEYLITDRAAYEEALEWIEKAATRPSFETYANEMVAARIRLFPNRNLVDFVLSLTHAYGHTTVLIALRKIVDVMCARAEELSKSGETEEFLKLAALWLALLIAPVIVIRWRLSLRLAPFGFTQRKGILSIAVLDLVLLMALAAYPLLVRFGLNPWTIGILAVPVVLATCRLAAHTWNCFYANPALRLFKMTTSGAVLPAYATAIIALTLTLPLYLAAEQRWMARETLLRIDPEAADLGAYEFKVAAQIRREINSIMGF